MAPVIMCLATLGNTTGQSFTVIVSDKFLSSRSDTCLASAPATWVTHRSTVEEKRVWAEKVKKAIKAVQVGELKSSWAVEAPNLIQDFAI